MCKSIYSIAVIVLSLALCACQTNQLKAYSRIEKGMDKHQVVEILGSPTTSSRWKGLDRWRYSFFSDEQPYSKEIHFKDGKAVYVGEEIQSSVTADEQDAKNEAANRELEAESLARKEAAKQALPMWEEEVKGDKKVRYLPDFVPIK